jgi:hypothetical protein
MTTMMATTTRMRGSVGLAVMLGVLGVLGGARPPEASADACTQVTLNVPSRPTRVLPTNQTPIRGQGGRNTCTASGAIAGLEAAYKRAGYGDLDLSEEFTNFMGKTLWLHPRWEETPNAAATETGHAAFGGGSGGSYVAAMAASNFRVPPESVMPYRPNGYDLGAYADWQSPYWSAQRNVSHLNLVGSRTALFTNVNALPQAALEAPLYYSAMSCSRLQPTSTTQLESAIALGKHVIWDSNTTFFGGSHSVLLVGYDRSSPNPFNWYFIVKDSQRAWNNPGGYAHLPYTFIARGYEAVTIDAVRPPSAWPELASLGRWNISFDGHHGSLDLYHIPGIWKGGWDAPYYSVTTVDRRLGTFYDANGAAYRVNGYLSGNLVSFYIDWSKPNLRYDEIPTGGRVFNYYRSAKTADLRPVMAGIHVDADRSVWGGYAMKALIPAHEYQWLPAAADPAGTWRAESFIGRFTFRSLTNRGLLTITHRDDTALAASEVGAYAGFRGTFRADISGLATSVIGKVPFAQPNVMNVMNMPGQSVQVRKLSREAGVAAGKNIHEGIYMMRAQ